MRSNQAPEAGPYWLEQVSRSQTERRILVPYHTHVLRLFHIYVMPCCRGKRILGLGLPV